MKPNHRNPFLRTVVTAATICLTLGQTAHAAALTWSGGGGDWGTVVAGGWSGIWNNSTADTGTFNGAGGTVSVLGDIVAGLGTSSTTGGALHFAAGNYTLQSDSASVVRNIRIGSTTNAAGFLSIASGVNTTIGDRVTLAKGSTNGEIRIRGGGTLTVGSGTVGGNATLSNTNGANTSFLEDGGKLVVTTGGTAAFGTSFVVGSLAAGASMEVTGGTVTIAGGGSNLVLGNGGVTSSVSFKMTGGSLTFNNSTNTANGTLRIGGAASSNTTGVVDLDGGILSVNRILEGGSGTTSSTINLNGGTIRGLYSDSTDFLAVDAINVKANGVTFDTNGRSIGINRPLQSDLVSLGGGVTKTGQGVLSLSGTNTYTGGTTVNQGALAFLNKAAVAATGSVSIAGGAGVTLGIKAGDTAFYETTDVDTLLSSGTLGNIAVNANGLAGIDTTQGAVSYSFTGASTRGLAKSGAGTLTLTGSNTYSGPTALYGGTLAISSPLNLGDNSATNSLILGSGTLLPTGLPYSLGTNRAVSMVGSATIQVDAADILTIDGSMSGSGSLTKTGTGTLVLSGANNYTGSTTVSAGTLSNGSASSFTGTTALSLAAGATFDLNGSNASITSLAGSTGTILNSAAGAGTNTLTVTAQAADGTGVLITDDGTRQIEVRLTSGGGALAATTNVNNTFSGGLVLGNLMRLQVLAGTVGSPGAITSGPFGRGPISINGGASNATGAQIWFSAASRTLVNDVIVNGNAGNGNRSGSFRLGATGCVVSGNINANGADAWFGSDAASSLLLSGQLTGLRGFRFYHSNGTSAWTATLNNATANPNDYAGNTTLDNTTVTLALGAAEQIPNGSGRGNVVINFGTLDLAGFNETINGLSGGGTAIVDNVSTGTTNTLTLGDGDATGLTFSGTIRNTTGTLSLVKTGSGTQTLSGPNTYGGTTTVNGGTLLVNGNQTTAAGNVQVNAGRLGGTGTLGGSVTVSATGTVNPGTAGTTGTLNAGATTIAGTFACDVNGANTDRIAVTGDLTLGGSLAVNEVAAGTPGTYVIATYTGTRSGTLGGTLPAGYSVNYDDANKEVELVIAAPGGFASWITGFGLAAGDQDPTDDPDSDGVDNLTEFAFNGQPADGSNNGLTALVLQDTTAPAGNELTLVAAVRDGAVFSAAGTTQTATIDGIVYTIEGSLDLVFPGSAVSTVAGASEATPAGTSLPAITGSGWEYRTFRLNASEGLPGKGFLRATVAATP